jgi:GNAT superfamily N-acetyltransferase
MKDNSVLNFHPLTPERWANFEALFGPHGAYCGCWCMWFRLRQAEFEAGQGEGNRQAMMAIVEAGQPTGILAYVENQAVGWCALAPRQDYSRLARSRNLAPVDDKPVWSIVCFYVKKGYRRQGVTVALLKEAIEYIRRQGATILEGYPVDKDSTPDPYAYHGLLSAFRKTGFVEVMRRAPNRPIMRYSLEKL